MGTKGLRLNYILGLPIAKQIYKLQQQFPQFKYSSRGDSVIWRGELKPSVSSSVYETKIKYSRGKSPEVNIISPSIPDNAPHIYKDEKNLCLYYPRDRDWHPRLYIADTILPWIIEWITLYELWQINTKWAGPEFDHGVAEKIVD